MIAFLQAHWRKLLAVALLVAAFAVGRYTTPGPDVVIASSIRFVERQVEVVRVEKARDRVVYRNVEIRPDGTKIDHSIERTETTTKTAKTDTVDRNGEGASSSSSIAYKPQWRVGALVGFSWSGVRLNPPGLGLDALAVGAFAERRIAGPFFVGLWALSAGPSFGLTLGVEF